MFKSLAKVDWGLLHEQKQILVTMRARLPEESSEYEALSGIIHLLDALQDDAVADGRWTFPNEDATSASLCPRG
jgi:nitrous oxide reductase